MMIGKSQIRIVGLILVVLCAHNYNLFPQKKIKYPVAEIPEELLKNSNAVIREDISKYEIHHLGKGRSYVKMAITILNKKGDRFAEVRIGYDKINKIVSVKGQRFDKWGKQISQLKSKDIEDYSAYDGFSIYSDNRIKYFDLRYPEYPYTIEYEFEIEENGFMSLSNWVPYSGFNVSSQQSSLTITTPKDYRIKYYEINIEPSTKEEVIGDKKVTSWNFGSFPAIIREPRMPYLQSILPQVLTAPSDFELEGYRGDMTDWASFGRWEKRLNEDRDLLPNEFARKINQLVSRDLSKTEKIKKLYEYLQSNTRYISIQLGIGGWQTFPASHVASNGYGDCKALSNFMKAMLNSVDIESYYTLVKAGRHTPNIIKEFPSNQFNHMILCVPNYQDTIWLECTSQDNPFGYLGRFTGDRDVLVINDEGGEIVHTKVYNKDDNKQNQSTKVELGTDGSAQISLQTNCTGLQYENFSALMDIGEKEQRKWLFENLDIPSFEIIDFQLEQMKKEIPELNAKIDVSVHRFASVSGKRLFFQPNIFNQRSSISIPQKERIYEFILDFPYEDVDSVLIKIPQGYHLEFIPERVTIDSPYGNYESQILPEDEKILYIRKCALIKGKFPASEYLDFVNFVNDIAEADKAKLVLVKST